MDHYYRNRYLIAAYIQICYLAAALLHIRFRFHWNHAEDGLASLLHLTVARPLPSVVTLAGMIDVTYLLDIPHGFTWKGVYVDADLRSVEIVAGYRLTSSALGSDQRERTFMQLSSLQGSILENRIFEDDFKVESISTAKLFQIGEHLRTLFPTLLLFDSRPRLRIE